MALVTLEVPREYGYVLLAATGTLFVNAWHGFRVSPFRKAAGVPYPNQYASQEQIATATDEKKKTALYLFNCAQRAHYNYLENHTSFLVALLISGLRFPVASAVLGALWSIGRIMYAVGYTRANKRNGSGRLIGAWATLVQLGLFGMAGFTSYKLIA